MSEGPFASSSQGKALEQAVANMLQEVFSNPGSISEFFTADYEQTSDGRILNRTEFEAHVRHVAGSVRSVHFTVLDAVQQGNVLADRHQVQVTHTDGRRAAIEVYLFGRLREGRLARVHEVTRLLSGDETLQALASESPSTLGEDP